MTLTFDVFTKKTRVYYIAEIISALVIVFFLLGYIFRIDKIDFGPVLMTLLNILIGTSCLFVLSFVLIVGSHFIRIYVKDGELILADDYLIIDGIKMPLNETKGITLRVAIRTNKSGRYLISNRIEVVDKNDNIYKNRFVISSYDNNEEFEKLIKLWHNGGVNFKIAYHQVLIN